MVKLECESGKNEKNEDINVFNPFYCLNSLNRYEHLSNGLELYSIYAVDDFYDEAEPL